jgi:site-specific DNA recombinase
MMKISNIYPIMKYLIYCRKSTDTEDKQVLSLESQESELRSLAEAHNLEIVGVLKESKSAKEPGRPVFNQLMQMMAFGKADAILCWKIDRLTRNPVDGGQIQWLLQTSKIKCITTFEKSFYPNDNVLLMSIEQAMANQYIRDLSVNVKRGNRAKLERGEWPNHVPFGYLNDKATKTAVIDPIRAPYVSRAYDLYLTGSYSFKDISDTLYKEGLRTKSGGKVFKSHIQRILTSVFYIGLMERDGKHYQGKQQALISRDTFSKAQDMMNNRTRPRPSKLFFPLRGFLKCENCGCALTASLKKGHHYYYCTGNREYYQEHKSYIREKYLYEKVSVILDSIAFSEQKVELMYQAAKEQLDASHGYLAQAEQNLRTTSETLSTKEQRLLDAFIGGQIDKTLYDQKALELQNERLTLNQEQSSLRMKQPALLLEPTKKVFLQASRARKDFLEGDDEKKRNILENLCWNLSIKEKNIHAVSLKSPFDIMFKTPKNGDISMLLAVSN